MTTLAALTLDLRDNANTLTQDQMSYIKSELKFITSISVV
jgi:hypothetical protein